MKKHYILVCTRKPSDDTCKASTAWLDFVASTQSIDNEGRGIERIGENTWLLRRDDAASSLAKIVSASEASGLSCRVLYLSSDD